MGLFYNDMAFFAILEVFLPPFLIENLLYRMFDRNVLFFGITL